MLHRGKYRVEGQEIKKTKLTFRNAISKLVGIDSQYSRSDKAIAWSVFGYNTILVFLIFLVIVIWNMISPWKVGWWVNWFFINRICITCIIGVITAIWFSIGGTRDLVRMFKRLKEKETNVQDDGRVVDHVSAEDIERFEKIEHPNT